MHALIILEITRTQNGALPDRLLQLAYRASQRGRILLLLNGISPFEVDAAIDPIVRQLPLDIPGLLYSDALDEGSIRDALSHAAMVFLSSRLARRYPAPGASAHSPYAALRKAEPILERLSRPTSLRELTRRGSRRMSRPSL